MRPTSPVFSMKFIAPAHAIHCLENSLVSTLGLVNTMVHGIIAGLLHPTSVALVYIHFACLMVSVR